jgi:hypothetical protein
MALLSHVPLLGIPAPPLGPRFFQLIHEHLARRIPELIGRPTQSGCCSAEAHKIRVAHLMEAGAHCFELERLEL